MTLATSIARVERVVENLDRRGIKSGILSYRPSDAFHHYFFALNYSRFMNVSLLNVHYEFMGVA